MSGHCKGCGNYHEEDDDRLCGRGKEKAAERELNITNGVPALFAALYPMLRAKARTMGYGLAIHGSLVRDMDLIAVPWVDEPETPDALAQALQDTIGGWISPSGQMYNWRTEGTPKPQGRVAYVLRFGGEAILHIDLSVTPRIEINP